MPAIATPLQLLDDAQRALTRAAEAPRGSAAMKAVLSDERVQRPGLDLRAQARRHPLRRGPRRRGERAAAVAQRPVAGRPLPGDRRRRSTARPADAVRRRRRGRRVRRRADELRAARAARPAPVPVFLYVFDVLWLDGHDVRALPLRARKRLLRDALAFHDPLRFTPHRNTRRRGAVPRGVPQGLGGR